MFKRMLFLIMTLFVCTVGAVAVGEDFTLFRKDVGGNLVPIEKPYSCIEEILGTYGADDILMTPVYQYNCATGFVTNETNDGCDYVEYFAHPGYYINMESPNTRNDCPLGFWCPGSENNYLPIDNESDCNAVETAGLEWHNNACFIKNTSVTVNINSEEQCNNASGLETVWENNKCRILLTTASNAYICGGADNVSDDSWTSNDTNKTILGKCKCPAGTTTGATETTGKNASVVQQCNWYKLDPGQQLKKNTQNNTYSVATCDADHYCEGGIFDAAHYSDSMSVCPKKHKNTQDTETPSMSGTSVAGSFRCAYSCAAGYYMHIANNGWKNAYSTCELCPEGYYCPGDNGESATYLTPTEYDAATYATEKDKYTSGTEIGKYKCDTGTTTNGRGAKSADECQIVYTCPAGQYLNVPASGTPTCEPCLSGFEWRNNECFVKGTSIKINANSQEACENMPASKSFCPGGSYTAGQADEHGNAGIYVCGQNIVSLRAWDDANNPIVPTEEQSACTCPDGYTWNSETLACCTPNKGCCGPGYMPLIDARTNQFLGCDKCQGNWGAEDDPSDPNHVYCPGYELTLRCEINATKGYRYNDQCLTCGADSVPTKSAQHLEEPDGCACTRDSMAVVYPDEPHNEGDVLVRSWNRATGKCELNTYSVSVWYANVDLNGKVSTHGNWNYSYWTKSFKYGYVQNNNEYVEQESFLVNWNPSDRGYTFTNPDTPEGLLARKVENGYVFAGWCRETSFCCPAGYEVANLTDGRKECVACADSTSASCNGSAYTPISEKPSINTKASENRKDTIVYYAMLVSETICDPGMYFNSGSLQCEDCPVGHYCPGGPVSTNNIGKNRCPWGTYRETVGATQKEYDANKLDSKGVLGDGCKPCEIGVEEELNISIPDGNLNGLTTQSEAATSLTQCGYYCGAEFYDANDNRYKCDKPCEAGSYCPGAGPTSYGWTSQFYSYTDPGQGMLDCPTGLTSDAGAKNCYMANCEATTYTKATYVDNKQNFACTSCDGNNPLTGLYYKCEGGKINVPLKAYSIQHQDSAGKTSCPSGQMSDEPADYCYNVYNPGQYKKPDGTYDYCPSGSFCPVNTTEPLNCPLGSTSPIGASSVYHCQCLNDLDLEDGVAPEHRPAGVYAEKGAKIHYDTTTNSYVCMNTYLTVGNTESYENATNDIPFAEARVVSCQWGSDHQTVGKYDKCTDKAMTICEKNTWGNDFVGTESNPVEISDVLTQLTNAFEETNVATLVNNMTAVSNVQNIETVGVCETMVCDNSYSHYDENGNYCYAAIEYNLDGGLLPTDVSNPERYVADILPIVLNNPTKAHHKFNGWCLEGEEPAVCLANNIQSGVDTETGEETTFVQRTITAGTTGDLLFNAQWQMVCPTENGFVHYDGDELTDVSQCYATVAFNTKGGTPVPETHKAYYTEGATSYTLNSLPQTQLNGYDFDGWYQVENPTETDAVVTTETELSGDRTLYAAWSLVPYTITYVENGGVEIADATYNITDTQPDGYVLATTTKTGYGLDGWCMYDAEQTPAVTTCDAASLANSLLPNTTGNKWAYAQWTPIRYTVAFDGNGATDGSTESETFEYDEEKALTANGFMKTGYGFAGWCDAIDDATKVCTNSANHYTNGQTVSNLAEVDGATVNMYANWEIITYSIAYNGMEDAELPEGTTNPVSYTVETESITLNNPTKDDYNFVGWCEGAENENCENPQETVVIAQGSTGDKVFWAKWQDAGCPEGFPTKDTDINKCYASITYNGMTGAVLPYDPENPTERLTNPSRYYADTVLPITLYNPTKDNYDFAGWYENGVAVTEIPLGSTGNKTYLATWTPIEYTITYHGVDGEDVEWPEDPENAGAYLTNPGSYNVDSADITLYNPRKALYTFGGWCDDEELTVNCSTTKTIESGSYGHKDFWAKWTLNSYTVTFDANATDTDTTKAEISCAYGVDCDITNNNEITRTDYGFVGWSTDKNATTAEYTTIINQSTELPGDTLKLYAIWTPVCNTGKYLHIGDDVRMCLYATSRTTPSLVIMIDNVKYYANMCKATECDKTITGNTERKLDIMYNDEVYNVYDLTAQ